jgi:sulfite reductase alpha subunit-like flavoprotein
MLLKEFWSKLEEFSGDLTGVKYAIFALGNSETGEDFCAAAKDLQTKLDSLGAKAIIPIVLSCENAYDGYVYDVFLLINSD